MLAKRYYLVLLIAAALAGCSGSSEDDGSGISSIRRVKEYIVEFTTKTGETIEQKAQTLSAALRSLWQQFFPRIEDDVLVDPNDPLRGELQGTYSLKIISKEADGKQTVLKLDLSHPPMRRMSEDSLWELDLSK